ncbi:cytolethal distending toxin subunit B family protein [Helicobacter ibis]|uniref:Cytolethal distending toxin subunit B family protein n=1 Tax=Helicobacter ibis TaxID=2962633 RepID=A0ABT4VG49_9HELI|nr:cytolethal distending toxin subunit B family protein [Helicobacter ibis]MDA3969675.1 cytolethal distending toxin subunit B family protein [Helicobacter ibis]
MRKVILSFVIFFSFVYAGLEDFNTGTWNLQGSSAATESKWNVSVRQLITGDSPLDVLMVQEAGVLPQSAIMTERVVQPVGVGIPTHEYEWNLGTASRPKSVWIYYSRIDVGANRVNVAIVSRQRADEVFVIPPPTVASRPILGIRIGDSAFFNVHALARGGNDAGALITAVDMQMRNQANVRNWIIAGDFNREPNMITNLIDPELASRITIVAQSSATQASGRVLDYAITGSSRGTYVAPPLAAILILAGLRTHLASDHFPVNFRRF